MRRVALLVVVLVLCATCGGPAPIPNADVLLRITVGSESVAPGQGFAVTVVRVWRKDMHAAGWDEALLSPLVLRLQNVSRREDETRIEETHRYLAYAFTLEDVDIPAPVFAARPKDGGMPRVVTAPRIQVRVQPVVDPAAPGEPELPGDPPTRQREWTWLLWLAALAGAGAGLLHAYRRHKSRFALPPEAPTPQEQALGMLAGAEDLVEAADVVRDYVTERHGIPARRRTTDELLAIGSVASDDLAVVLRSADEVKYAGLRPSAARTDVALDAARAYVREAVR